MFDRMAASKPPTAATALLVTLPDSVAGNASPACFVTGLAVVPPTALDSVLEAHPLEVTGQGSGHRRRAVVIGILPSAAQLQFAVRLRPEG
jgi:hypothetical protein